MFDYKEKEYVIENINEETKFDEQYYIITKNEFEKNIQNEDFKYIEFKDYIVLQNKNTKE